MSRQEVSRKDAKAQRTGLEEREKRLLEMISVADMVHRAAKASLNSPTHFRAVNWTNVDADLAKLRRYASYFRRAVTAAREAEAP